MRRIPGFLGAAALAAGGVLYAQTAALKPVEALPDPVPGLFYPGQTLDSAPPSTSRILPVTQPDAGVAR